MNGDKISVPFVDYDADFEITKLGNYLVFDSPEFSVRFDLVDKMIRINNCGPVVDGVCGNGNGKTSDDKIDTDFYLVDQDQCNKLDKKKKK
jgi:hypothetical protein